MATHKCIYCLQTKEDTKFNREHVVPQMNVVGYMWYPEKEQWIFCGCLTWFGDLTYIFKLGDTSQKVKVNTLDSTRMACFNNVDRTIAEDDAIHIFQRRPDGL